MNTNKQLIFLFIFFICIAGAMAVKPSVQTSASDTQLVILFPHQEFFELGSMPEIHFHILNSTGYTLDASESTCLFELFNASGSHLIEINMSDDVNGIDKVFRVNSTNIPADQRVIGIFPYVVTCNATNGQAGYVNFYFEVTTDGQSSNHQGMALIAMIILIPLIFGLFMIIGAATIGSEHNVLRIFLFLLSIPMIFISFNYAMIGVVNFYGLSDLQSSIGTTTYWIAIIFGVLVAYFIIYGIWKAVETIKQKKKSAMEY